MRHLILLTLTILLTTQSYAWQYPTLATTDPGISPQTLTAQLKTALPTTAKTIVSLAGPSGYGTAVIISPDGLLLTAAHLAKAYKPNQLASITLADGTKTKAKSLGHNLETDLALFQITENPATPYPHATLAKSASTTGAFCFTLGHPSGILAGRPAQPRLGRITSHSIVRNKPGILTADCDIQPGDSGGGLFNLKGELIGINSSAANLIGLNLFTAIDQFHIDEPRLLNSEQWGNPDIGPTHPSNFKFTLNKTNLAKIQAEFTRRSEINYPPTTDFIQKNAKQQINQRQLINHLKKTALFIGMGQPTCLGLDDPAITNQLPPLPKNHTLPIHILSQNITIASALALNKQHLVTKASILKEKPNLHITLNGKNHPLNILATDTDWDIAILGLPSKLELPVIDWNNIAPAPQTGDLLIAPDHKNRPLWGHTMDTPRPIGTARSTGPIEQTEISTHRAPYPPVLANNLPLFAIHAGTPVFNAKGQFIGQHTARSSRTTALLIPAQILKKISLNLLKQTHQPSSPPLLPRAESSKHPSLGLQS